MKEAVIRPYKREDRPQLRNIAWKTAFMGEPGDIFFDSKELLVDFLTLYYTDYEPESAFVAESEGRVIGYLTGAKEVRILRKVFHTKILGRLCCDVLFQGAFLKKKNIIFIFNLLKSLLKGELMTPDFSKDYPATLHINLEKDFRGAGVGARLIAAYLEYLAREKVAGVHFGSISEAGASFFKKHNFEVLYQAQRSYFRYILHKDLPACVFGKHMV